MENLLLDANFEGENPGYIGSVKRKKLTQEDLINNAFIADDMASTPAVTSVTDLAPIDSYWEKGETYKDLLNGQTDYLAKQQGGLIKILNSTGQMVGTFGTSLASTAATLIGGGAGLLAEGADMFMDGDQFNGMDIMLNNPIMKGISDFDKYIKEEIVPTYYTKEQQENIILNGGLASTGTDLLNGLGFMASAALPSQAISKVFGNMAKMVAASKLAKIEPMLDAALKVGKITNNEAAIISKTANYLQKAGPIVGATVGRIGESAMEAYGSYEQIKDSLTAENQLAQQELNLYGTTDKKIRTPEEIEEEAKRGRNNVFMGNMALAAFDLAQYTRWFKGGNLADDLIKDGLSTTIKQKTKGDILKEVLLESGQEAAEEGYQFLLSKGAEKSANGKSFIEGISEASGDLFTTTEGLKSMLLGAVLGGGVGTGLKKLNEKNVKMNLANAAMELTANADTTQRYIPGPDGKLIINPELSKTATTFAYYEKKKEEALSQGYQIAHDTFEKMQFSELVEAKIKAEQFDEFIDQLEEMGRSNPEEIKSMFGNLPIKNGKEMTPMQIATEKIMEAKKIKELSEGLDLLPQLTNNSKSAKNYIKQRLFAQEALRNQILNVDSKIAEVNSKMVPSIITNDNPISELTLHPWDKIELDRLENDKQILTDNYLEISKDLKELIANSNKAEEKVENIQNKNVKEAIDTEQNKIREDIKNTDAAKEKVDKIKEKADEPIVVETIEGDIVVQNVNGELIDTQTGEKVEDELIETFKQETLNKQESEIDKVPDYVDDYDETRTIIEFSKKPDIFSTSTRGHEINYENNREKVIDGIKYKLYSLHEKITKWFSNPKNNTQSKNYTAKLELLPSNEETLEGLEAKRKVLENKYIIHGVYFPDLNINSPGYQTIRLRLFENGKLVQESEDNAIHFHTIDHFYDTQQLEDIINSSNSKEEVHERTKQAIDKLIEERTKLIKNVNTAELTISDKSPGILNFLPNVDGVKPVLNLETVFKNNKSKGLGVVESIDVENNIALIRYDKVANPIEFRADNLKIGQKVYIVKSANNKDYLISNLTFNKISNEHLEALVNMIFFKVTTDINTIKHNKVEYKLWNGGIIDNLLYVGKRTKSERQIDILKNGTVQIGKDNFTKEQILENPEEFKSKLRIILDAYNSLPVYTLGTLNDDLILPTEIDEEGNAKGKVMTYKQLLLNGDNPLIGINVDPEIPFINSYFTFAKNANGDLDYKVETKNEPYLNNLEGNVQLINEKTGQITNEEVDENKNTEESPIEEKKADIERRRKDELGSILSDVNELRQANTVGKAQVAIVKATQESSLPKAVNNAGVIIGQDVTVQSYNDIIGVSKKLADAIEKIQKSQIDKINAKYDAELKALENNKSEETQNQEVINTIQETNKIVNQELDKIKAECGNAPITKTEVNTTNKGIQTSIKNIDNFDF